MNNAELQIDNRHVNTRDRILESIQTTRAKKMETKTTRNRLMAYKVNRAMWSSKKKKKKKMWGTKLKPRLSA